MPPKRVHNAVPELARFLVPISELAEHPDNPRRGDVAIVRASLREHGQYRLAVVQASTGYVCVGNHMLQAARAEGWTHLAAIRRDLTDDQARRLRLVDNRSHDLGGYDDEMLVAELRQVAAAAEDPDDEAGVAAALAAVGYDQMTLAGLEAAVHGRPAAPPAQAPGAFGDPEAGMTTEFQCPNCAYEWSGLPKPSQQPLPAEAA